MSIKFIKDKEFDLSNSSNEDLLGTKPYAETLFEVIKGSSGKQNIGLFGGWGSGKSTIIETLHNFILEWNSNKRNEQIAFFKYDAWKYSNDDFRRSFLKSLNSEFKAIDAQDLDKILYQDISREDNKNATINVNIGNIALYVLSLLLLFLCIYYVLPSVISSTEKLALAIFSVLTTFLFAVSRDTFRVTPFTIRESKIIEAEKFEDTFKLITNNIFGTSSNFFNNVKNTFVCKDIYKKMVVVIDNLDRCDNENLKETLSSMKNFLENSKIIFVLPVDENGITCFLDIDDSDEYLRKIFHQIIRLKKFTPKELDEFTNKLNKKYDLELSNTGIRLICQEFTTNPRKIIQFLNNLQTERDLIKRQITANYISLEFNEQVDDFLIKLLIIKQEWSEIYKNILDDVNYLNKLNEALRHKDEQQDSKYCLKTKNGDIILSRDQKRFFKRNINVHFKNIEPFILNIDRDKDIPDELREHIENGELNEALEILSIVDEKDFNEINIKILLSQIENVYDYNSNKFDDYNFIALPVSEMLFELLEIENVKAEIKMSIKNYGFINRIFNDNQFLSLIPNLNNYEKYCISAKWFHEELNYKVPHSRLFKYLNDSINPGITIEGIHDKIKIFIDVFRDNKELLLGFRKNLKNKILKEPILLTTSYKIFEKDIDLAYTVLDSEFIDGMLELLNQNRIDDKKTISSIVNITEGYVNKNYIQDSSILTEYSNYLLNNLKLEFNFKRATAKGVFDLKSIVDSLNKILAKSDIDSLKVDTTVFDNILQRLNLEYSSRLTKDEVEFYISFLNMILNYMHLNNDFGEDVNFDKYFNTYFDKTDFIELSFGINEIYQKEINHFEAHSWNFFNNLIGKLNKHKRLKFIDTLMLMLKKSKKEEGLTEAQKIELGSNLIQFFIYYSKLKQSTTTIKTIKTISNYITDYRKISKDLFTNVIKGLSIQNLEDYVYHVHRMDNNNLISNSFITYLDKQNNFKSFEKFIKFIKKTYHIEIQSELFEKSFLLKHPKFDWFFKTKKYIDKRIFNKIIEEYINQYPGSHKNNDYLNNLLKLQKSEIYKSTIDDITKFESLIQNPTKRDIRKIETIKSRLN